MMYLILLYCKWENHLTEAKTTTRSTV